MLEDIVLDKFPKEAGAYLFKVDDEVIYVGSSKSLYRRMAVHKAAIKRGSEHGYKQDLYQYLQLNQFTVEFKLTDDYRQLEQELVERYHPKYNSNRAKGLDVERQKKTHRKASNNYESQLCCYNNEVLTLATLSMRFIKAGITHPTIEAKKYLMGGNDED